MINVPEIFGCMVFDKDAMRAKLPKDIYRALKNTIENGAHLELDVANAVAVSMRDWAMERGVTHFTHWFQPLTGITAEKHDSFISPDGHGGVIMEFSGKSLVKGEPDASSFPSGGLRATFEARGYTAWDPTSYAFIKDNVLCIPTAFCSYSGEALDKKTPLLRSMEALEKQALRILKIFGDDATRVIAQVGPEQEYFLIDREVYLKRPDLMNTGRTLLGARPPKGQELDDHYFGAIKKRVKSFMTELDVELWKLGVLAKTEHNEVAPAQHELAVIHNTANIATDANQIIMELMKSIALKHGLVCLLHEKPFAGVNGSGKHNNWSIVTDRGVNLLEPGRTPAQNARFLLFLCAMIKAVDEYSDLLRVCVATAGNDHRLGAHEAPPAVVSIFLGDELTDILSAIEDGTLYKDRELTQMEVGVTVLPHFFKDTTDRNRTSPFAFTGNKFEFRMPGSSISVAGPNIVLNTIVAEALSQFADRLEGSENISDDIQRLLQDTVKQHKRIIFNGNGYDDEWLAQAERLGLSNIIATPDAVPLFISKQNIELFAKHRVLSESEMLSRYDIMLESYCKTLNIEALTMLDMVYKYIIPSVVAYQSELSALAASKQSIGGIPMDFELTLLKKISVLSEHMLYKVAVLEENLSQICSASYTLIEQAKQYKDKVLTAMEYLREEVDELELIVAKKHWQLPTYDDILYSVK